MSTVPPLRTKLAVVKTVEPLMTLPAMVTVPPVIVTVLFVVAAAVVVFLPNWMENEPVLPMVTVPPEMFRLPT